MNQYDTLKALIEEIDILISQQVCSSDPVFKAWKVKTERFLINTYGETSFEHKEFMKCIFHVTYPFVNTTHNEYVQACIKGLNSSKAILSTYLDEFKDIDSSIKPDSKESERRVFIVHGRDDSIKDAVARFVEKQKLDAIILNEQPNKGKTIIEKIESFSNVKVAICLFSADDTGRLKTDTTESLRARQNVVFEAGYFIGKLGREHVITIVENGVEIPSDLQGIVYTSSEHWKIDLLKELNALGFDIDINQI